MIEFILKSADEDCKKLMYDQLLRKAVYKEIVVNEFGNYVVYTAMEQSKKHGPEHVNKVLSQLYAANYQYIKKTKFG